MPRDTSGVINSPSPLQDQDRVSITPFIPTRNLQANLEIDRAPAAQDPVDPVADAEALKSGDGKIVAAADINVSSTGGQLQKVFSFVAMLMFTFILVV